MTPEQLNKAEEEGLHKKFKLDSNLNMSNIVSSFVLSFPKARNLVKTTSLSMSLYGSWTFILFEVLNPEDVT